MHGPEGATSFWARSRMELGTLVLWLGKSDLNKLTGERARAGYERARAS